MPLWLCAVLVMAAQLAGVAEAGPPRVVCFITNWAQYRLCASWKPVQLNATLCTHVNYAFAGLNNSDFSIELREWNDASELIPQAQALKKQNPALKLLIALGGWTFNNPTAPTRKLFSQAVATNASRAQFIKKTMAWMDAFKFDGMDIDWEYPGDLNRGGTVNDRRNLAFFFQEFQAANARRQRRLLLTMSVAAGAAGRTGLDMPVMIRTLDFVNIMTYDYHGPWESRVNHQAPWRDPLGGSLSIASTLDFFIRVARWPKWKLNVGLATFGRTWQLQPVPCRPPVGTLVGPGAKASGPGPGAKCTEEAGYMGWMEIRELVAVGTKVAIVPEAMTAYLVTPDDVWVSFDLPETQWMKVMEVQRMGLGGVMVWAADLDDRASTMLRVIKYRQNPGSYRQYLWRPLRPPLKRRLPTNATRLGCVNPAGGGGVSVAGGGGIGVDTQGLFCGEGSVGNGACVNRALCCSQWGHCGAGPSHCALERGCMGGPCWSLPGLGPAPSNGTSLTDSRAQYAEMSALKGALGGGAKPM